METIWWRWRRQRRGWVKRRRLERVVRWG